MKASDFVARYLEAQRVSHCFELVGGMITHLLDSINRQTSIKIISCHHEQAAGFAAEGMARIAGTPGIALATSGPGATNLLTAIGSCYFDSTPAIFITGQVNTYELRGTSGARQLGFQETDIVAMAKPVTKWSIQVQDVSELPDILEKAFACAIEHRQGPCLVDIPMNIQSASIDDFEAKKYLERVNLPRKSVSQNHNQEIREWLKSLLKAIKSAKRPLLLLGGGCANSHNRVAAREISQNLGIPTVLSLMGIDVIPCSQKERVGLIGSYGNRWANQILGEADLLVVIGSRLDIRQTGANIASFCEGKEIWQVDIDPAEIGLRVKPQHQLLADIQLLNQELKQLLTTRNYRIFPQNHHADWQAYISQKRAQYPAIAEYSANGHEINPVNLLQSLSHYFSQPTIYVTDVGQHQMWAAQSLDIQAEDRFLTSGGMGAMGFGLPAAIGAALASPDSATILISGDGGFQVNIQELETIKRNNLNLKIILFNNQCHGMVRQFQESYFNNNLQSTVRGYSAPQFVKVAQAYGVTAAKLSDSEQMQQLLSTLSSSRGPALLEVSLPQNSKVYPKLAFGRRFGEMEPDTKPIAMEST